MTVTIQQQLEAKGIVKLQHQFYCACCQQWKCWGCIKCGLVFATFEKAISHECTGCVPKGRA